MRGHVTVGVVGQGEEAPCIGYLCLISPALLHLTLKIFVMIVKLLLSIFLG